ncbi:YjiH family protein [Corynebacterium uberis]|uniref:YjiH family protein n=1 Tax=Corynebacterium uberis TaxID=2883169 RepID=UPI001D0BB5B6|nr:YjiH family protein [Corynebacterium uberis]UDL73752.1 YjiH family protein [Corynebacterium uberis]UDL75365.1 YjiH family protein [Corynebacterium uberis]UDL77576.1 YjiH family protein [Corynebacterium uberis]UDL79863.1 YjiH family protein [Corynebacterium uberis]UDL81993.1 YjiH family protein [Corynebacterium uberis]
MSRTRKPRLWEFFVYSAIGAAVFFLPVTYQGKSSIPLDHMVTIIRQLLGPACGWLILALVAYGTYRSIMGARWRNSLLSASFVLVNSIGLLVALAQVTGVLPGVLGREDLVPFLWNKIAIPVGLIVPVGSAFLALIVSYGLLEFVGVLMQPVMRPVWRTPGRSAIDAVASFVGSYSLGLLITDRVYKQGRYTTREAAIIATGFSTVSAAFMVIVAKTAGIMHVWGLYFVVSLVVTFAVTAITVWIPPLSLFPDDHYPGSTPDPEEKVTGNRWAAAWAEAKRTLAQSPGLVHAVKENFIDGVRMSAAITPSIMAIGLGGLLLATFTPVFEWVGYLFYPFAWLVRLPEPLLAGKAAAMGIAEMLLPATVVADADSVVLRFVIAVVAVSAIIFFSALVPCILATEIPLKIWQLVVIWFERVVLTIVIATPIAHLLL